MTKEHINAFVQHRWDERWAAGTHGHYETLFAVVHDALAWVHDTEKREAEQRRTVDDQTH